FSVVFAISMSSLWIATPAASEYTIFMVLLAFVCATVCAEFNSVFSNAIMPGLVPPQELGRLSGAGWACGYVGGLVSLILMAGLIVPDPQTGKTLLGLDPLFALDSASRQGDRIVGPFSAAWFLIFMIPFFLFVPDIRQRAHDGRPATTELWNT